MIVPTRSGLPIERSTANGNSSTKSARPIAFRGIVRLRFLPFSGIGWTFQGGRRSILSRTSRMCTLTFVPTVDGYLAGMNRDELRTRPTALPPKIHERDGMSVVYPREPSGGTWIACNSSGNLLALLNWNEVDPVSLGQKRKTRGLVIPELIREVSSSSTNSCLKRLNLDGVFPFRLIEVFQSERKLVEWRWDGTAIQQLGWAWVCKHWFSSSLSDSRALVERGRICEVAALDPAAGSESWLRSLHRSHDPKPGPYTICVHRRGASTVSYTEVECDRSSISMKYLSGSPCLKENFDEFATVHLSGPLAAQHFA